MRLLGRSAPDFEEELPALLQRLMESVANSWFTTVNLLRLAKWNFGLFRTNFHWKFHRGVSPLKLGWDELTFWERVNLAASVFLRGKIQMYWAVPNLHDGCLLGGVCLRKTIISGFRPSKKNCSQFHFFYVKRLKSLKSLNTSLKNMSFPRLFPFPSEFCHEFCWVHSARTNPTASKPWRKKNRWAWPKSRPSSKSDTPRFQSDG